jgi:hypothetical protein
MDGWNPTKKKRDISGTKWKNRRQPFFAYVVSCCNDDDDIVMWLIEKLGIERSESDGPALSSHGHEA